MRIALAGAPGAGKTALFDLLANKPGDTSGRTGLMMAHVEVPDPRLQALSTAYKPKKTTPARLQFDDLELKSGPAYPALAPARKEMLAQADLCLLVIDLFNYEPEEWPEAVTRQWHQALDEFVILDLATVEGRLERLQKALRIGQKPAFPGEPEAMEKLRVHLEAGRPVLVADLTAEERRGLRGYAFLSERPLLPAFNVAESHLNGTEQKLSAALATSGTAIPPGVFFCAEVERQIMELAPEEQQEFLSAFQLSEPAIAQVIRQSYALAGLHCFFTVGDDEVRAWSIRIGTLAPGAAGAIHSDLEKGFVRAEVLAYEDWIRYGTHAAARDKGAVRVEGREYLVKDGDIIDFRSGLAKSRG